MAGFFRKLFLSTIGSMPAKYNPEVDTWWGVVLTELGFLDPFREENLTYLLISFLCTVFFALFLWALSLSNTYHDMRKQRDNAQEASRKGAYEWCDLHNKLRDTENELYYANERLQDAENSMDEERKELRDTIQGLNDQRLVDEEEIRYLTQHVSNTECDHEEYGRRLNYASRKNEKLAEENQKLKLEHQRLEASLAEKDETINSLQAHGNDIIAGAVAAAPPPYPIYIQSLTVRDTAGEQATADEDLEKQVIAKDGELAESRIKTLEQQNGTLNIGISGLRTDLETLRDEHGGCSGNLSTQLGEKDDEIRNLQAEKTRVEKESTETIATLRIELTNKENEITDLEEANETLVSESSHSAGTVRRLHAVSHELEVARSAHAQCEENSTSQGSRIDQLVTAKEQLEQTLHVKDDEIERLQRQVQPSLDELAELKETHAKCGEDANTQALEITRLRNANEVFRGTNADLPQQLGTSQNEHASLIQDGQLLENQNKTLRDLQSCTQTEVRSLQGQIENLNRTVGHQQQRIQTLETNCPSCQKLREALDEVVKDVEMSDDNTRAEMRREVAAELMSQVPDDLRRQVRGEVEREVRQSFQNHYSNLLARNSSRLKEQDRLLLEKDAKLEKTKNAPIVNHAACEKNETNLRSSITKSQQDAKIAKENYSRLNGEAKHNREQLRDAQTVIGNLRVELETIKADQRRAQNVNPLQGRLTKCQRDLDIMKDDRNKARDNCSIYSKQLSDLKKEYKTLENEFVAFRGKSSVDGDRMMDDGRTEEPVRVQDEQQKAISALRNEVSRLSKELEERKAGENAQAKASSSTPVRSGGGLSQNPAQDSDDEAEDKPVPKPVRGSGRRLTSRPTREPTTMPMLGGRAGKKREYDEYSDGEADDEAGDDRKKVKIEGGMHGYRPSGNKPVPAQGDELQEGKDMK